MRILGRKSRKRLQKTPLFTANSLSAFFRLWRHFHSRKNSLFFKTLNGARVGDTFMSLIHTCEISGTNPFDYLTELLRHRSELKRAPQDWMPWDYSQAIDPGAAVHRSACVIPPPPAKPNAPRGALQLCPRASKCVAPTHGLHCIKCGHEDSIIHEQSRAQRRSCRTVSLLSTLSKALPVKGYYARYRPCSATAAILPDVSSSRPRSPAGRGPTPSAAN